MLPYRFICFMLIMACAALQGCISLPPLVFGADRGKVGVEEIEPADHFWTTDEVLMIPLSGLVDTGSYQARLGEPGMLVALKDRLKAAEDSRRIKAVILRVDSPGGGVTAADLIHQEILRFKQKKKIPIIALMTDVAASGGLYVAMAADEIYALPTTITGSIGVITLLPGVKGLSDKIGFEMRVIASGKNKDIGSPWREMTPEDRQIFQNLIDKYYQIFLKIILESRQAKGLTPERLKALADGRILDAETAKNEKLIDGIKYPQAVFEQAKTAAGIHDARLISYEYPYIYRGNIYARQGAEAPRATGPGSWGESGGDFNLLKLDLGGLGGLTRGPRFMYLWLP